MDEKVVEWLELDKLKQKASVEDGEGEEGVRSDHCWLWH